MKNLKNEKGGITILVLVSVLFMVAFLISSYVIISNKVQAQKEIVSQTKEIYESKKGMEEIYNSYFNQGNIIPIYTVEQLMMIGEVHNNVYINGKYYNFNNEENTIYELMNDLEFSASDYPEELTDTGYWIPIADRNLNCNFEGKGHTITVTYTDEENDNYTVVYSKENGYSEPEYEINVIPQDLLGTVIDEAVILIDDEETENIGESIIKVRRLQETKISAYLGEEYTVPEQTITIINPTKIQNIILTIENI